MKVDNIISNIFKFILILYQEKDSYMSHDYRKEIFNKFITKNDISEIDLNDFHYSVIDKNKNINFNDLIDIVGVENLIDDETYSHKILENIVSEYISKKGKLYKIIRRKIILNNLV